MSGKTPANIPPSISERSLVMNQGLEAHPPAIPIRISLGSHAAVTDVHAIDDGITERSAVLDNSPAHHRIPAPKAVLREAAFV